MDRLEVAKTIAREAGKVILQTARGAAAQKEDLSFLTAADTASQRVIVAALERQFPGEAIIAEEQDSPKLASGATWMVDPLDGTAEYKVGAPGHAVCIAYREQGAPELGVMYFPAQDVLVSAARGTGCFVNGRKCLLDSSEILLQTRLGLDLSPNVPTEVWLTIIEPLRKAASYPRNNPTAQSFLDLLSGYTGAYFSSNQSIWDVAAGVVALEEAGGCVFKRDGTSPTWDAIRMGPMFYCASPRLKEEMLQAVNRPSGPSL